MSTPLSLSYMGGGANHNWLAHLEQWPVQNHEHIHIYSQPDLMAASCKVRTEKVSGNEKKTSCTRTSLPLKFCLQCQVTLPCPFPYTSAVRVTRTLVQNSVLSFPFSIQTLCSVWHIYKNTENLNPAGAEKIFAIWIHPWIWRSITQTQTELIHFNHWAQFW